jgi:hypothetical protein
MHVQRVAWRSAWFRALLEPVFLERQKVLVASTWWDASGHDHGGFTGSLILFVRELLLELGQLIGRRFGHVLMMTMSSAVIGLPVRGALPPSDPPGVLGGVLN